MVTHGCPHTPSSEWASPWAWRRWAPPRPAGPKGARSLQRRQIRPWHRCPVTSSPPPHIQVILCFSPVGSTLHVRARKFPAEVNCTAIDWFHEWPEEALVSVSARFLQETEGIQVRGAGHKPRVQSSPQGPLGVEIVTGVSLGHHADTEEACTEQIQFQIN